MGMARYRFQASCMHVPRRIRLRTRMGMKRCSVSVRAAVRLLASMRLARAPAVSASPVYSHAPPFRPPLSRLPFSSSALAVSNSAARRRPTLTCSFSRQLDAGLCTKADPGVRKEPKTISITFIDRDDDEMKVQGKLGDTLLEVAHENDIDVEGACEGTLSCSTCHLIVDPSWYDKIPDPLTEEEQDMLDLAYGLTDTSRLGCQIVVTKELDGIKFTVPSGTADVRNL